MKVPVALFAGLCLLTTLPLSGCYGNVEHFAEKAAKHSCKRMRECERADFEERYNGDLGRCRDDVYTDFLDFHDNFLEQLNCEYIPEEARECVAVMRSANRDCSEAADDDIADACDRVYDCPGLLGRDGEELSVGQAIAERVQATPGAPVSPVSIIED